MKVYIAIFSTLSFITTNLSFAQENSHRLDYGIEMKLNSATQLNKNPSKPGDGTFQNDRLGTYGAGAFITFPKSDRLSFTSKVGYIQNGFEVYYQTPSGGGTNSLGSGSVIEETSGTLLYIKQENRYHYLFTDLLGRYSFGRGMVRASVYAGLRPKYLISKNTESETLFNDTSTFNNYYGYNNFRKFALGYIMGVGIQINKLMNIEFEINPDVTNSVSNSYLKARNWLTSATIGINISQIKKGI